jgi:hypothetical protein
MADDAGELTFSFGADLTGLTRAAADAGKVLDDLGRRAAAFSGDTATALSKPFDGAGASGPLRLTDGMTRAASALRTPTPVPVATASGSADDGAAAKELGSLSDQLALLRTTGAAHDAIVESMKIEAAQAKLGADATDAQKDAVAALVGQINAAKTAQTALKGEQAATDTAWRSGSTQVTQGLDSIILDHARVQDVASSLISNVARQGLSAALTGTGSLAGLFGTAGANGQVGGLAGAIEGVFTGGLGGAAAQQGGGIAATFAGLFASGGSLDAGQWGIVGEKGAELVAGPATVVPMNRMATASPAAAQTTHQTINFNVASPDAPSFARSEGQMSALLSRLVARGQRNA